MTAKGAPPSLDRRLAELARRQYGVVSRRQLTELGLGSEGVLDRVRSGRLHRLHRGVYAVGHRSLRAEGHWVAAVLACGPGAVLSHRSAGALWELRFAEGAAVDVTVPCRHGRRRRAGIRVHRTGRLSPEEVEVRRGIRTTGVARTLLDLADVLPDQALRRTVDEAEYRRLFDLSSIVAVVEANPGRGARLLTLAGAPPERTRSRLEERFLELVARHRLPRPRAGVRVEGYEVDFLRPDQRVIVELDGLAAHGKRSALERDRLRDRRLLRAGLRTVRLTSRALDEERAAVADLRAILAAVPAVRGRPKGGRGG